MTAENDADFLDQVIESVANLQPGAFIIGGGNVGPAAVRQAQQLLRERGAHLLWLYATGRDIVNVHIGLPENLDDATRERAYEVLEAAFPELLEPLVQVNLDSLPQVLALSASGR